MMKTGMKISLDEVKYIQTEIERLLNMYNNNPKQAKHQQQFQKDKFSSIAQPSSRKPQEGRKYNRTTEVTPERAQEKINTNRSASKSPSKTNQKSQINEQPKTKQKKQQRDQNKSQVKKKKTLNFAPQSTGFNLSSILEQKPQIEDRNEKINKTTFRDSSKDSEVSAKQLHKKWTLIEKGLSMTQIKAGQRQKQFDKKPDESDKKQTPKKSVKHKNKSTSPKDNSLQPKKRYFPHGLTEMIKNNKTKSDNGSISPNVLYQTPDKKSKPYHLNSKNSIPIRDDEDYLRRKYKQKNQRKQKKQDLVLKYHVLDQRLNKLRQQIQTEPMTKRFQKFQEKTKIRVSRNYKDALRSYLRYSPLNKLLKSNQKLKTEYESSISNSNKKMALNQKKYKELFQDGRPIWNM